MAFAIIETGGKQYRVAEGDILKVEKLPTEEGGTVTFDKVLLYDDGATTTVGTPYIKGAKVEASVEAQGKHNKIIVFRFKSKSRYRKKTGHRQPYTQVKITAMK